MNASTQRKRPIHVWRIDERSPEQTRVLSDVLARIAEGRRPAAGVGPVVTFDLDSTLFDNRPRQLAILAEFARANGLAGVERIRVHEVDGWHVADLIPWLEGAQGDEEALVASFKDFWRSVFFTSEYCRHDAPLPGAADFVREVEGMGAQVVYLTGRHEDMRRGTADSLQASGFPPGTLLMKPTFEMTDTEWKELAVGKLREMGTVVACFDNEPTHCNRLQAAFPGAEVVWLRTDHSPQAEALAAGIPPVFGFLR